MNTENTTPRHYAEIGAEDAACGQSVASLGADLVSSDWMETTCDFCSMHHIHYAGGGMAEMHRQPYLYKGGSGCLLAVLHNLSHDIDQPMFSFHASLLLGTDPDQMLRDVAQLQGVDLTDPESYSSEDFPKAATLEELGEVDPDDYCGACMVRWRDLARVSRFNIVGTTGADGERVPLALLGDDDVQAFGIPGYPNTWQALVNTASLVEALNKVQAQEMEPNPHDAFARLFDPAE